MNAWYECTVVLLNTLLKYFEFPNFDSMEVIQVLMSIMQTLQLSNHNIFG
jgi:hypothetical protein